MAAAKKSASAPADNDDLGTRAEARKVSEADDGGESRFTKGYEGAPDKPDPSSIAQVEVLHE